MLSLVGCLLLLLLCGRVPQEANSLPEVDVVKEKKEYCIQRQHPGRVGSIFRMAVENVVPSHVHFVEDVRENGEAEDDPEEEEDSKPAAIEKPKS